MKDLFGFYIRKNKRDLLIEFVIQIYKEGFCKNFSHYDIIHFLYKTLETDTSFCKFKYLDVLRTKSKFLYKSFPAS